MSVVSLKFFDWVVFDISVISFGLFFDSLTSYMLFIITGISFLVHVYSLGYMSHDPYITRFISYLSLFTFFMIFLVTADNFLQMFIGWEGVGLCSYLLINFWFTRILANKAALKAMIMNRIADIFFIIAIVFILLTFKSVEFSLVFLLVDFIKNDNIILFNFLINKIDFICFLFFIGAVGKSAQLGLHTWLPDAMEGPTPVSSLLHAATMVTAGVFLILRTSPFFEYSDTVLVFVTIIGGFTAFFSAIIGVFQYDIKKVIAYSTCSQLGYMFFSCGLSNYHIAIFHLFNHAFFKALLFLSAGSIIHALFDEQDMRRMGGLVNFLPLTYFFIFLGSMAIMGFPFLTGFYSKDLLLELAFTRYHIHASFIHFLGISSAFFTAVYSTRLILYVFFFKTNMFKSFFGYHESTGFMLFSMVVLSFCSMFVGYIFSDLTVGIGTYAWNNALFFLPSHFNHIDADFLHPVIKNLPLIFSIFGCLFFILIHDFVPLNKIIYKISWFFSSAGFFNTIYNSIFIKTFVLSYDIANKFVDKGLLEYFGPFGIYKGFRSFSYILQQYSPVFLFFHISIIFFFLVFFFLFIFLHFKILVFFFFNTGILFILLLLLFLDSKTAG